MRILYLHQYFCTPLGSGGTRSFEFARRWVCDGHSVHVVCGRSFDKTLKLGQDGNTHGITYTVYDIEYDARMSFIRRIFSFILFCFYSVFHVIKFGNRYDVILATSTPLTVAIPALVWNAMFRKPVIFEVRDVWPDAAVDAGVLKSKVLITLAELLEQAIYRTSSVIVALSDGMVSRIARKGISLNRICMIPNCCDLDRANCYELKHKKNVRQKLGLPLDKPIIVYAGSLNLANDVSFLVDFITAWDKTNAGYILFLGAGSKGDFLKDSVISNSLKNVILMGPVSKELVYDYISCCDVGFVSFLTTPVYYENSPNKFFDYITCGLPVVFSRSTWLKKYVEQYGAGLICEDNQVEQVVAKTASLISTELSLIEGSRRARSLAEEVFSRDSLSEKYLRLIGDSLGRNSCVI